MLSVFTWPVLSVISIFAEQGILPCWIHVTLLLMLEEYMTPANTDTTTIRGLCFCVLYFC